MGYRPPRPQPSRRPRRAGQIVHDESIQLIHSAQRLFEELAVAWMTTLGLIVGWIGRDPRAGACDGGGSRCRHELPADRLVVANVLVLNQSPAPGEPYTLPRCDPNTDSTGFKSAGRCRLGYGGPAVTLARGRFRQTAGVRAHAAGPAPGTGCARFCGASRNIRETLRRAGG
jgi:hypothetical protein